MAEAVLPRSCADRVRRRAFRRLVDVRQALAAAMERLQVLIVDELEALKRELEFTNKRQDVFRIAIRELQESRPATAPVSDQESQTILAGPSAAVENVTTQHDSISSPLDLPTQDAGRVEPSSECAHEWQEVGGLETNPERLKFMVNRDYHHHPNRWVCYKCGALKLNDVILVPAAAQDTSTSQKQV